MKILPDLNLNKHPQSYTNGGLVYANNIIVSPDNSVIQTEPIPTNSKLDALLRACFSYDYEIKYILTCNKECVVFMTKEDDDSLLTLVRYSEEQNALDVTGCDIEYVDGGYFVGTFTYNNNNLIIAFSEYSYDNSINLPLRTINLGEFAIRTPGKIKTYAARRDPSITTGGTIYAGNIETTDIKLQSLVPEVILPRVETEDITGYNSYKGFYYIFIRFKISTDNYTQWYNTNASYLLDETSRETYFDLSGLVDFDSTKTLYRSVSKAYMSDDDDYCGKALKCTVVFDNDYAFTDDFSTSSRPEYTGYQLAYAIIRKSFSKVYKTNDLDLDYDNEQEVIFNHKFDTEITLDELITNYYNYYNVKALANFGNKLYIGNYNEREDITDTELKSLGITITADYTVEEPATKIAGDPNTYTDNDGSSNMPHNVYNFFVHFIDKYGIATNGYNFSNFNISADNDIVYVNSIGNRLLFVGEDQLINFKLSSIPDQYCGYFFSYEMPEYYNVYFCNLECITTKDHKYDVLCYTGELDLLDTIDFSFNKLVIIKGAKREDNHTVYTDTSLISHGFGYETDPDLSYSSKTYKWTYYLNHIPYYASGQDELVYTIVAEYDITNKTIFAANAPDNIGSQSCIRITVDADDYDALDDNIGDSHFGFLVKDYSATKQSDGSYLIESYANTAKTLLPCSPIQYGSSSLDINTKTAFYTHLYYINYNHFLDSSTKNYITWNCIGLPVLFNTTLNQFQIEKYTDPCIAPIFHCTWQYFRPNQLDYKSINNDPEIAIVPIDGLNTTDVTDKSYVVSKVVQCQNSIDLWEYKYYTYYDGHPATLDWYNPDAFTEYQFPKTIRRSNILQDESQDNTWKQFPIEAYKIINENKGAIIKLIAIGKYLMIHTEHSLFLFSGDDSIKSASNDNGDIQLASIDIWDINYKEVVSSTLGKAGISKEWHGIIGDYGYIWYDADAYRIYRFDNGSTFVTIDQNITNFVNKLVGYDVNVVEDKLRNRILFNFTKDETSYILSYNYATNSFVSFHSYTFVKGYNTKTEIYLVDSENNVNDFNDKYLDDYSTEDVTNYNTASINIMFNEDFFTMKSLEYIKYNVREVVKRILYDLYPEEELDNYYRGNQLRVYNDIFDTGYIDITYTDEQEEEIQYIINKDYRKPYWRFGNWHFNYLRNSLHNAPNSRCFGNYFVVEFKFETSQQVEIENVDVYCTNGELT